MQTATYQQRRGQLETYFDRTAMDAWARLTSDAPVSRIRATVRAGRDEMRATLLSWLPDDLRGCRLLDAGCGTGALAVEAARRGAQVVAIDVALTLIELARKRAPCDLGAGAIEFHVGDMLDPALGRFDHVVAMDSLIHYSAADCVGAVAALAARTGGSVVYTFAPRTPALTVMHAVGRLFPRSERAPAIQPISESLMQAMLASAKGLNGWRPGRTRRVASGFYKSQAMEICRP
jgi:magnesium-protoporphyrin O-methyltransferase